MSEIEYFYSAQSAYAWLGSAAFMEIATALWRIFFDLWNRRQRSIRNPEFNPLSINQHQL